MKGITTAQESKIRASERKVIARAMRKQSVSFERSAAFGAKRGKYKDAASFQMQAQITREWARSIEMGEV